MFEKIWDITPKINSKLAVFPGDQPFEKKVSMDMQKGDHLGLSSIHTTMHLGAHADAPLHYKKDGEGIAERKLEFYLGVCRVIRVSLKRGERLQLRDLPSSSLEKVPPRILFRTDSFTNPYSWSDDFNSLSASLIKELAKRGVRLVGIDTPSIDPAQDKILESHQAIASLDMAILEGLDLQQVIEGDYTLIALPLRIENGDASPVRAVLIK